MKYTNYTAEELDDALRAVAHLESGDAQPEDASAWGKRAMILADCLFESSRKLDQAQDACRSAFRAIVLGSGREIDWVSIADELQEAISL